MPIGQMLCRLFVACGVLMWFFAGADAWPRDMDLLSELLPKNRDVGSGIRVTLKADKTELPPGAEVGISAETDREGYLTVLYLSDTGKVIMLWPTRESRWDHRVQANRLVPISGPAAGIQLQVDGNRPYERIVAYATTRPHEILSEKDFRESPDGRVKEFKGPAAELLLALRKGIESLPSDLAWGTTQLTLRVLSDSPSRPNGRETARPAASKPAVAKASYKPSPPLAIRALNGRFLSVKGKAVVVGGNTPGPSESFQLHFLGNARYKIVGQNGVCLTAAGGEGSQSRVTDVFVLLPLTYGSMVSLGTTFRAFNGKYVSVPSTAGAPLEFKHCSPTVDGIFTLIPVLPGRVKGLEEEASVPLNLAEKGDVSEGSPFIMK